MKSNEMYLAIQSGRRHIISPQVKRVRAKVRKEGMQDFVLEFLKLLIKRHLTSESFQHE
jgi:hypothetical protein